MEIPNTKGVVFMKTNIYELLEKEIMSSDMSEEEKNRQLSKLLNARGQKINLMLVGATGSGKSSTINSLFNTSVAKAENGAYTYNGVTGKQVIEYIETYLASAGFLIDSENELFGMFIFNLSNSKTQECIRVSYSKSDKILFVTLSVG